MGPDIEYASNAALTDILEAVDRPGDFCTHGRLYLPMPVLAVEGVGTLSFPVAEAQIDALIEVAGRAPYGKGPQTIVDTSVRDCWQVDAAQLRIGGHAWAETFAAILGAAAAGLGCDPERLDARLYKLLVYPTGGFFAPHRDTEKAEGMVATLTISLPTAGRDGQLVVRHGEREMVIDMTAQEPSELAFAAFYADCAHETRPVTAGHRLSLVYNLCIHPGDADTPRQPPDYAAETAALAKELSAWLDDGATDKLVWLLEHDYSAAGLSFSTLKNADAAVARVLAAAAENAGCALHTASVHIEESGHALYPDGDYVDHWDSPSADDMIMGELYEWRHWLDGWVARDGSEPPFGAMPLREEELLPPDALDDAEPDEQRVHEASGNEGVSLERSYRHAALAIWPRSKTLDVVADAGIADAVEWVAGQLAAEGLGAQVRGLIVRLTDLWTHNANERDEDATRCRVRMLDLLTETDDAGLVHRFLRGAMLSYYGGGENDSLLNALALIGEQPVRQFLGDFVAAHFARRPDATMALLRQVAEQPDPLPRAALRAGIDQAVAALPAALDPKRPADYWSPFDRWLTLGAAGLRDLVAVALCCDAADSAKAAATVICEHPEAVTPDRTIPTALNDLGNEPGLAETAAYATLWRHAVDFLLARSANPPLPPEDWVIAANVECPCELCDKLRAFCADPVARVERFAVRSDLRRHLHGIIDSNGLDLFHETERRGRPYTLVCTKNRATHERRLAEYADDVVAMGSLLESAPGGDQASDCRPLLARLQHSVLATERRDPRV